MVAAGSGERLGGPVPKAFAEIGGRTLIEHALARFSEHPRFARVVLVVPAAQLRSAARLVGAAAQVTAGGRTRQESVAAGLAAVPVGAAYVLVHDVARPFVPPAVIDAVVAALDDGADAVVPVIALHDTIRRIGTGGVLAGVVDRASLVAVQTPQGFRRDVLVRAHAAATAPATDDATLVEAMGGRVVSVRGADEAFKITTAADLARAQALVLGSAAPGSTATESAVTLPTVRGDR